MKAETEAKPPCANKVARTRVLVLKLNEHEVEALKRLVVRHAFLNQSECLRHLIRAADDDSGAGL
jgi:Arc/MetJ-type ribon-helix-helix transcriptional regulator